MEGISEFLVCNSDGKEYTCFICGRKFVPKIQNFHYHSCWISKDLVFTGYACQSCIDNQKPCQHCGQPVKTSGCMIGNSSSSTTQHPTNEPIDTTDESQLPTREEVEDMLIKLYSSDVYNRLVARREHKAFLELFGKARLENGISSFLVWLFGNKQLNTIAIPPILHLLRLIAFKSLPEAENGTPKLEPELRDAILINRFQILNVEVIGEDVIEKGRADIKITITYKLLDSVSKSNGDTSASAPQKLVLIIENKIDSTEGENQCGRYEVHYTAEAKKDGSKVAFVFLSVIKPDVLTSEKFIKITHQDILDRVLQPLLVHSSQFSAEILRYIEAYIDSITSFNPYDKKPPIAMDETLRKLLIAFLKENEDLIGAAIEAKRQEDPNSSLVNDFDNVTKGRSKAKFKLIYTESGNKVESKEFGMNKALLHFAQTLLKLNSSLAPKLKQISVSRCANPVITKERYDNLKDSGKKNHVLIDGSNDELYANANVWMADNFSELQQFVREIGEPYEMEIVKC